MGPRFLFASTNLARPWLSATVRRLVQGCARGAVVTNGEPQQRERARNAVLALEALGAAGVARVEYVDLERNGSPNLARFDCVCLADGNPFVLLECLRNSEGADAIEVLINAGRPVLACGAGAAVLGRTLRHLRAFDTSVSPLGSSNPTALGLLQYSLLPFANRWRARWCDYGSRLEAARRIFGPIVELDDNEALLIDGPEPVHLMGFPGASEATRLADVACLTQTGQAAQGGVR